MLYCKFCSRPGLTKAGINSRNKKQIYFCKFCKRKSYIVLSKGKNFQGNLLEFLKFTRKDIRTKILEINLCLIDTAILYKHIELSKCYLYKQDADIFDKIEKLAFSAKQLELKLELVNKEKFKSNLVLISKIWSKLSKDLDAQLSELKIQYLNIKYRYNLS